MEYFIIFIIAFTFYVVGYQGYNFYKRKVEKEYEGKAPAPRELDISEPVVSFVKTFKENPKRFTYVKDKDRENIINSRVSYIRKILTDTFTKEVFEITEINLCKWKLNHPNIILTEDEIDYIDKEIVTPYNERKAKYVETKLNRECVQEKRKELKERRRLTKIYQQEK